MSVKPIGAKDAHPWIIFTMNSGHRRRVASTFQHVEDLLRKAEAVLSGAESQAPFSQVILDAEPWQREIIQSHAARVRGLLKATLDQFAIAMPGPQFSASHSAQVILMGAEIDLEELGGRRLEWYGPLPPEEARTLAAANAEILSALKEMRAVLGESPENGHPNEPFQDGRDA